MLTLVFGILGMTFSAMLMVSPGLTKNLSHILNRNVNVDEKLSFLDKSIDISDYFYDHHVAVGLLFICGSTFVLSFFYISLDITRFSKIFFGPQQQMVWGEIFFHTILWIGKITCLAGLLFGSLLLFVPNKMKCLENNLNVWFETNTVLKKLDQSSNNVDSFFFRHPRAIGISGAALSFLILCLSIINLLD
jgi:hypothetical protein